MSTLGLWYPQEFSFDLHTYSDANFDGYKVDSKNTSGTCQFLGNMLISWFSKKQTKHINIIYHFIRNHIEKRDVVLMFVPTQDHTADIFTKPLDEQMFSILIRKLGLFDID
ncbi:hypothetical protein CFOL_v3_04619 [Cephalotus follicularis]|uniref:Uncharacterized protein n=1 Tax=Cephalotus follicularis TaxID=3775 RepID=A0A1Q3AZA5_CEPFO|nr:hypothetical protein CFOL_v3_04619 [Cephalotus follicularis]